MISVITFYTPEYKEEAVAWRRSCHSFLQENTTTHIRSNHMKCQVKILGFITAQ